MLERGLSFGGLAVTSEIDICNLALLRLGTRSSVASFSEGSVEANACARVYGLLRDMLLSSHPWSFATRRVELADLGQPPPQWQYRYAYPSDCLHIRQLHDPRGGRNVPVFLIASDLDDLGNPIKVVLCNLPAAQMTYTVRMEAVEMFPPHFVEALAWMIAAELANALTGDDALSTNAMQMAAAAVNASKVNDANENAAAQEHLPDWVMVRGFVHT